MMNRAGVPDRMCGICGEIRFDNKEVDKKSIQTMNKTLFHRGPDDSGEYYYKNIGLGHRRLSIIDLSDRGHQPMSCNSGDIWLTFNGEIFNYIELRNELKDLGYEFETSTDTEVIIQAYKEYGEKCLEKFNGMFSFVIFDKGRNIVFGARDRYGIKPFYYFKNMEKMVFASEIKAIIQDSEVPRKANQQIIFDYLIYNRYDHTENTFFEGIKRLPASHFFIIKDGKMKIERWWETKIEDKKPIQYDVEVKKFKKLFTESVKLRLRSDVPVGSCLSGGLDSSSIVCTVKNMIEEKGDFQTFSAVYDEDWEKDEGRYIQEIIDSTGLQKNITTPTGEKLREELMQFIYHQEEPVGHTSFFAQWEVMRLASRKKTKVLLDGQGADELLAGYKYFFGYYFFELIKNFRFIVFFREFQIYLKIHREKFGFLMFLFLLTPRFLQDKISKKINVGSDITSRNWISKDFHKKFMGKSRVLDDFIKADGLNDSLRKHIAHKLEHLLRCEDKSSMAFSIETRLPFLDYRLVDYLFTLPSNTKINEGVTKRILRDSMKGLIPRTILERKDKIGFETMEDNWFKSAEFKEFILNIINSKKFQKRGYLDPEEVQKEVTDFFDKNKKISRTIWRWINLELWFRIFIDENVNPTEVG